MANISLPLEMKIKLDLIPHVYDRPGRVVQVITGEGKTRPVMLNQAFTMMNGRPVAVPTGMGVGAPAPQDVKHYDLSKGRYGISVTIGKSNDSRLQEGSDSIGRLMEADPQLLPILGPSWASFQDFPGAHAVSLALKKWQSHVAPWMSDDGQQTAAAQLSKMQQQLQEVTQAATAMKKDLETDTVKAQRDVQIAQLENDMKLKLEQLKFQHETQLQAMKDATEIEKARITVAKEAMIAERERAEEAIALDRTLAANAIEAESGRAHEASAHGMEHAATLAEQQQVHGHAVAEAAQTNDHALQQADVQRQIAEAAPAPETQNAS